MRILHAEQLLAFTSTTLSPTRRVVPQKTPRTSRYCADVTILLSMTRSSSARLVAESISSEGFSETAKTVVHLDYVSFGGELPILRIRLRNFQIVIEGRGGGDTVKVTYLTTLTTTTTPTSPTTPGVRPAVAAGSRNATTIDPSFSQGGYYWGGTVAVFMTKHIAGTFNYTRMMLPSFTTSRAADMYSGGVMVLIAPMKTLFKFGHE